MQSKGWIRLVAILLAIASIWQLSFTAVTTIQEKKADKFAEKAAQAAMSSANFAKIAPENQAYYLDSRSGKTRTGSTLIPFPTRRFTFGTPTRTARPRRSTSVWTSREV